VRIKIKLKIMNTIKKEEMVKNSNQSKITLSHYKQIGIDLLKDELKELRSGEDFWKFSMKTKGISVTKMKWKGVVPYDSIEEYEEDVSSIVRGIKRLENELETIKN
jgi:hypothetical protein|tara:strand:+ start:65 stop:382 length:318 start_codon:yes stop_codon:yes gene_type:complete